MLMSITLLAACSFAYVYATDPERIHERSLQATRKLHVDFGVPMTDIYVTHIATELPIRDENGDVTTGSCGPHFDLTQPQYDRAMLRKMATTIRKVVPRVSCSHVAIYVNSRIYDDMQFVAELQALLPSVVVFDESRHLSRLGPQT
jgi:hypothetical protein